MGQVGGDDKDGGGNPYNILKEDHGGEGAKKHRRYVVHTGGQRYV